MSYRIRLEILCRGSEGLVDILTGFLQLDAPLAGLQLSDLIALVARFAIGKTRIALSNAHSS